MGIDRDTFYNKEQVVIVPLIFCYLGMGKAGDLPPRIECVLAWREKVLQQLTQVELIVVIGCYAMHYHLSEARNQTVADAVKLLADYWQHTISSLHPSPRNNR